MRLGTSWGGALPSRRDAWVRGFPSPRIPPSMPSGGLVVQASSLPARSMALLPATPPLTPPRFRLLDDVPRRYCARNRLQ